jgi:HEAT repeat protein
VSTPTPPSRRAERRRLARDLLRAWDLPGLLALYQRTPAVLSVLVGHLNELDEELRWRAIHALGRLVEVRAEAHLEGVRELIRRQLWAMNDESGNVSPHAAEAVAEMLYRVPALYPEYISNLMAHLDEELFRPGLLWGLARLAGHGELILEHLPQVTAALGDPDPAVRGPAALALGRALHAAGTQGWQAEQLAGARLALAALARDAAELRIFDEASGELRPRRIGELVSGLLEVGGGPATRG